MGFNFESNFAFNQKFSYDFHKNVKNISQWDLISTRYDDWLNSREVIDRLNTPIIPKHFHQIWLGSKIPKKYDLWRKSWMKYNPDYEYTLWDEQSIMKLGIRNERAFCKTKNVGAKSDLARYGILEKLGGIYMDTDFECVKPIDIGLLGVDFFCGNIFDNSPQLANGIMGTAKGGKMVSLMVTETNYPVRGDDPMEIINQVGAGKMSEVFFWNFDVVGGALVLPSDYFYPWPNFCMSDVNNRYSYLSNVSLGIHHWEVSWTRKSLFTRFLSLVSGYKSNKFNWLSV